MTIGFCCCDSTPPTFLCNLGSARPSLHWNDGIPSCFLQYGKIGLPSPQFDNDRLDRGGVSQHTLENASWSTSGLTLSKSRDGITIIVTCDAAIVVGTNGTTGVTTYRHPVKEFYAQKGSNVIHLEYVSTGPTSMQLNRFSDDTYNGCFYPGVVMFQSAMLIPGALAAPIVTISCIDPGSSGWSNGGPGGPGNPCASSGLEAAYYPNDSSNAYDYTNTFLIEDGLCTGSSGTIHFSHGGTNFSSSNYSVQSFTETNIEDWYTKTASYFTLVAQGSTYSVPPGFPGTTTWSGEGPFNPHYPAGATWTAGFKGVTGSAISGGGLSPISVAMDFTGCGFPLNGSGCRALASPCSPSNTAADGSWNMNYIGCSGGLSFSIGVAF